MKNKKIIIIGIISFMVGVLVIGILLASRGGAPAPEIDKVTVQKDGKSLTVGRDGRVSYELDGKTYEDVWDSDKVGAFFDYFSGSYDGEGELVTAGSNSVTIVSGGGSKTYVLNDDDEITDAAGDDVVNGGGDGGGGGGGVGDVINGTSPSPTAVPTSSSSSGGYTGPDPECLYWRLSYCVRKRTPSPIPSAVATTVSEIRPPDCGSNTQTGKTVIGNDLCLQTPSPTPQ